MALPELIVEIRDVTPKQTVPNYAPLPRSVGETLCTYMCFLYGYWVVTNTVSAVLLIPNRIKDTNPVYRQDLLVKSVSHSHCPLIVVYVIVSVYLFCFLNDKVG